MKPLFPIVALFLLFACQNRTRNFDGSQKNYTSITRDTNCINPWSDAFFELKNKNFDTIALALKTKIQAVLGPEVFDEGQYSNMQDSIRKTIFSIGQAFQSGDIQVDTTNLSALKDYLPYYLSNKLTPRKVDDWKCHFLRDDYFTYQQSAEVEIGYLFYPCIKKILRKEGTFKRLRKGSTLPDYATGSNGHVDQIHIYDCLLTLTIHLNIDDKSGFFDPERQFYEVKLADTAKLFTIKELDWGSEKAAMGGRAGGS